MPADISNYTTTEPKQAIKSELVPLHTLILSEGKNFNETGAFTSKAISETGSFASKQLNKATTFNYNSVNR